MSKCASGGGGGGQQRGGGVSSGNVKGQMVVSGSGPAVRRPAL